MQLQDATAGEIRRQSMAGRVAPSLDQFIPIGQMLPSGLHRLLGYPRHERFVMFYFEPRAGEVMWMDSTTSGFGAGGWQAFEDHVLPIASSFNVRLSGRRNENHHALVFDCAADRIYLAPRSAAERFVRETSQPTPQF